MHFPVVAILLLAAPAWADADILVSTTSGLPGPLVLGSAVIAAQTLPAEAHWDEVRAGDAVRVTNTRGALFSGTVRRVVKKELVLDWLDQGMALTLKRREVARVELRDRFPARGPDLPTRQAAFTRDVETASLLLVSAEDESPCLRAARAALGDCLRDTGGGCQAQFRAVEAGATAPCPSEAPGHEEASPLPTAVPTEASLALAPPARDVTFGLSPSGSYGDGFRRGRQAAKRRTFAPGFMLMGKPSVPTWLTSQLDVEGRTPEYRQGVADGYTDGIKHIKCGRNGCNAFAVLVEFLLLFATLGAAASQH